MSTIDKFLEWKDRFLNQRLNYQSRLVLLVSVLFLFGSYFFPLWQMHLVAPQYQDGLDLYIYSYQLEAGHDGQDLKEINLLNHYIGMEHIQESDFTEMRWMPFVIGFFILFTLRNIVFGTMSNLVDNLVLFIYFSLFSLANFAYRLYSYGHNLDPKAPMNPEPFMPTLIGTKQIQNFTQTSLPHGATFLLTGFLLCMVIAMYLSRNEELAYPKQDD